MAGFTHPNKQPSHQTSVPLAMPHVRTQSYAGGRNLWGSRGLSEREKERGLKEPSLNDGLLEVGVQGRMWVTLLGLEVVRL